MGEAIITRRGGAGEAIVEFENFIGNRRENPGFQSGDERRLAAINILHRAVAYHKSVGLGRSLRGYGELGRRR